MSRVQRHTDHATLVARLTAELRPVEPLPPPWRRLGSWCGIAAGVVVVATLVGLREDVLAVLGRPRFAMEVATLLVAAGSAAAAALVAAVPGYGGSRVLAGVAAALSMVAFALLGTSEASTASSVLVGMRCASCVVLFSALPGAALFLAVRRAAPLRTRRIAAYLGAAGFLVGLASVRVACPFDAPAHVFAWHVVPALVGIAVAARAAEASLDRWRTALDATA